MAFTERGIQMADLQFVVDSSACTRCGACVKDCPASVIRLESGSLPRIDAEKADDCIQCQHCLAVCPTGALSIFGLKPENSLKLGKESALDLEKEELALRGRRSVRQFSLDSVDSVLIERLLKDTAYSPTGCNSRSLTFTLIDGRPAMERALERLVSSLEAAKQAGHMPEALSFVSGAAEAYRKSGADVFFRGAPHLLIVSAPGCSVCKGEDAIIALSTFERVATAAGLGTTWCGFFKIILDIVPELKAEFGLADDCGYYAMLFGHPKVKYARTVQRDADACIRRIFQ